MDDLRFDRWTRGLAERVTRRKLGSMAVGAGAAAGLTAAEAKGKKKKGKKKKHPTMPDPTPTTPAPEACVPVSRECVSGQSTCCKTELTSDDAICLPKRREAFHDYCCYEEGTRLSRWPGAIGCCGTGWKSDIEGRFDVPGMCCVENGETPPAGKTAEHCCNGAITYQGRCALPPGHSCYLDHHSLCWNGDKCGGNGACALA